MNPLDNLKPIFTLLLGVFTVIINTLDLVQAYIAILVGVLTIVFMVYQIAIKHGEVLDRKENKQKGESK